MALKQKKKDIAASRVSVELQTVFSVSGFPRAFYLKMWTYSFTLQRINNSPLGAGGQRTISIMINIRELIDEEGTLIIPEFLNAGTMEHSQGLRYQLQVVGHNTFDGLLNLRKLVIPTTVTNIKWCFYQCYNLAAFEVAEDNPEFCSIDGVLFTKDRKTLVAFPNAHSKDYIVPQGVETIGHFAFKTCRNIEFLRLSDTVREIGINALYGCNSLKTVYLPDNFRTLQKHTESANVRCMFEFQNKQYSYVQILNKF